MTRNMGSTDRALRFGVGVLIIVLAMFAGLGGEGWLRWAAILVGAVMVGTAAMRSCPLYTVLGIRTCKG
jgi:hypothetical protein